VTDMSWRRVSHPSQVLAVGDTVAVKIIRINPETTLGTASQTASLLAQQSQA